MLTKQAPELTATKRPRGRPPLAVTGKRKLEASCVRVTQQPLLPNAPPLIAPIIASENKVLTQSKDASDAVRNMKPNLVIQKILSRLMSSDPQSMANLLQAFPDASKDSIQSSLDILQVLGIVVPLKPKPGSGVSSSSSQLLFAALNFSRGDFPCTLHEIEQTTKSKIARSDVIRSRNGLLMELSRSISSDIPDKIHACKAVLIDLKAQEPMVGRDPLFVALANCVNADELGQKFSLRRLTTSLGDSTLKSSGERMRILKNSGSWCTIHHDASSLPREVRVRSKVTSAAIPLEHLTDRKFVVGDGSTFSPPICEDSHVVKLVDVIPSSDFLSVKRWIIFSDLHVKSSSIDICETVLAHVHNEALARDAGIIFLGDFWHVRGAVSVELLNRVLSSLNSWTQPVILIPGNHDQVTLGGNIHALEPLTYAFNRDKVVLLSEPSVFLGAAWLPYRREHATMQLLLQQCCLRDDIDVIYCHADVKGAYMNDGIRSMDGLQIDEFPAKKPVYSGHFHKPHTIWIPNGSERGYLRYVGSPYQTSLSEAGQTKYLYEMTCERTVRKDGTRAFRWSETDRWPINIGRKYFKLTSIRDATAENAIAGDRIVVPVSFGEEYEASKMSEVLRAKGINVELRNKKIPSLPPPMSKGILSPIAIIEPETSDPVNLFKIFVNELNFEKATGSFEDEKLSRSPSDVRPLRENVVQEGVNILEKLIKTANSAINDLPRRSMKTHDLHLDTVRLTNFGPYGQQPVRYPLSKRGLVLLTGQSIDGTGADSNGSGKTTLVMSVLWALTGSLDVRLVPDGKTSNVAYDPGDAHKQRPKYGFTAEVAVNGCINGQEFSVTRRRNLKSTELYFSLDGINMTTQSVKDTQLVIDQTLGIGDGLLQRCCFFGQHSHTLQSLLGLTDGRLKSELSMLVDSEIWATAVQHVRQCDRAAKIRLSDLSVEMRLRLEELDRAKQALSISEAAVIAAQTKVDGIRYRMTQITERNRALLLSETEGKSQGEIKIELEYSSDRMARLLAEIDDLKGQLTAFNRRNAVVVADVDRQLADLRVKMAHNRALQESSFGNKVALELKILDMNSQIERLRGSELSSEKIDESILVAKQNALRMEFSTISSSIAAAKRSLDNMTNKDCPIELHGSSCPTCGQVLPADQLNERLNVLKASVLQWNIDQSLLEVEIKKVSDILLKSQEIAKYMLQAEFLERRRTETKLELSKLNEKVDMCIAEQERLENLCEPLVVSRERAVTDRNRFETLTQGDIKRLEGHYQQYQLRNAELRKKLEAVVSLSQLTSAEETFANSDLSVEQSKLDSLIQQLICYQEDVSRLDDLYRKLEVEQKALLTQSRIFEYLVHFFGPKGVQHFIFSKVLRDIEDQCNQYLLVLADGGIQLRMQGDEEIEKILKSVYVRGVDSEYRERSLSQLSGGQWRRISMALDLAFAEIVRQRGILRSNIIVMDEVLTHLDASGREAVGTILRSLLGASVDGHPPTMTKSLSSSYETVLVILQDLAAMEMEESFDHVDIVLKDMSGATVKIDGIKTKKIAI